MIVARRLLINGRVQGVGFRFFAEAQAAVDGVHGYVRNLPDGRVEAGARGIRRGGIDTAVGASDGLLGQELRWMH